MPPGDRDAWSHAHTPEFLCRELTTRGLLQRPEGQRLKSRLEFLYKLRIDADYSPTSLVGMDDARRAIRESGIIVKVIRGLLPDA